MEWKLLLLVITLTIHAAVGPPVNEKKTQEQEDEKNIAENEIGDNSKVHLNVEYDHYLKEVVSALESDPEFRAKLEKADEVDIRNGKIAQELEFVNHNVRTKLDELKRQELERLRHLAKMEYEVKNGIDTGHLKIAPEHLDHSNPHTFEMEDLRKLIAKTSADLAEVDRKRQEEFKQYEMQKEYEKQQALQNLDEENKIKLEEEYKKLEQKHKKHEPLHHPGSKQQLEEVWEKQDHMENQDFDPKTFFFLHDLDGNGFWDQAEVKALFLKELDKLYNSGAPEDDMRERVEEMERMREHVFKEADTNKDNLISFQEFMAQTRKPEFEKDQGWQSLDQQQLYTPEEYHRFEQQRQAEVQRMIQQGLIPPQPVYAPYHGYHPGMHVPPHLQPQFHPAQQGMHPNQIPQGYYQGQQYHPAQGYPAQGQPNYQQYVPQGHPQVQQHIPQGHPQVQQHMPQGHPQAQQVVPQGQPQVQQVNQGQPQVQQLSQGQQPQVQPVPQGQPPQVQQVPQGQAQVQQVPQGQAQVQQVPQGQPQVQQVPQGQPQVQQVPQGQPQVQQVPQGQPQVQQVPQGQPQVQQVPQGRPQVQQVSQGQQPQMQQVPQGQQLPQAQQIPRVGSIPVLHHPPQPPPNNPQQHIDVGHLSQ